MHAGPLFWVSCRSASPVFLLVQVHAVLTDVTVEKHNRRIIRFLPPDEEGDSEASSPQDSKELGPK